MLKIELPFPAPELMPNRKNGRHWTVTNTAKNEAWKAGYALTHEAMRHHAGEWHPTNGVVPITLTFCPPDKRKRDLDNLLAASKPVLDGVAAALLMDDREFEPITVKRGAQMKPGMVLVEIGA